MAMQACPYCEKPLAPKAVFCQSCGGKLHGNGSLEREVARGVKQAALDRQTAGCLGCLFFILVPVAFIFGSPLVGIPVLLLGGYLVNYFYRR